MHTKSTLRKKQPTALELIATKTETPMATQIPPPMATSNSPT